MYNSRVPQSMAVFLFFAAMVITEGFVDEL
jgi:hypothetical protein